MAITSIGYDGSVNETQWAKLIPLAGTAHYGVAGAPDLKVTAHGTLDRGLIVATGSGWGHGVLDTNTTTVTLQGGTVSSGSRWDLVVARRNWAGAGGVTSFVIIPGGAGKALPTRNTSPGTLDDQPLALVQFTAGNSGATAIVDLRCWSRNGGMMAKDDLALTYLKMPGAQIMINGTQWNCELDANGNASWTTFVAGRIPLFGSVAAALDGPAGSNPANLINAGQQFLIQCGSTVNYTDAAGNARLTFQKPFPNGLITVLGFNGDDYAYQTGGVTIASSGYNGVFGASAYGSVRDWVYCVHGFAASNNDGPVIRKVNQIHRINWIAIGW